ncbi:MAG: hypothetical protein IEMM0008_0119 [bacterium]|nr:MAG: hypothetical protein IEMM0008_0119 [bacterium]
MTQRDIYLVNLDPAIKTEIGKTRPAVIVSSNVINKHYSRVIVLPITSNIRHLS